MITSIRLLCVFLVLSLVSACATWVRLEEPHVVAPDKSFTVEVPVGWVRAAMVSDKVLITRDGTGVQFIRVGKREHKEAFPKIKKSTTAEMLPTELAELVIAEVKSEKNMSGLKILSNTPADIDQRTGFRLHLQMKNQDGLRYEVVVYGLVDKGGFYELTFRAPTLHYFQRDLPAFEQAVKSFRLTGKTV